MDDMKWLNILDMQKELSVKKVVKCNEYTVKFGVQLTQEEAFYLMESRTEQLKKQERVEFGDTILPKLIYAFCDSSYIYQDNYVETLEGLQELFYLCKNESMDVLSDDELLERMKIEFEGRCQGSLEYLEEICVDEVCRNSRM